jgi:hypothetical protein
MANIYEEKSEPLHQMLDRSRGDDGATVLIPDLQRPYVWTPNQVALLVDSLIRGWPFGTLLMWKVTHGELQTIPHRAFWRTVVRTADADGSAVTRKDPPAQFHMVLDGQQRVQSLLLALGGDAWGFQLEDRTWAQELQDRRPRGRPGKKRHWSKACLCFDLDQFSEEYSARGSLLGVDFRNVLQWAITDPTEGQSKWPKPDNYEEPLPRAYAKENLGRFVRLSRLWSAAAPNPNIKEAQFQKVIQELFEKEGIPKSKLDSIQAPMGELMTTLRDLKLSKVTYLELLPYDEQLWCEDDYNDAIVNIFTRLNTAGRTLTREEITLAWLKVGWEPEAAGNEPAGTCFQALLSAINARGLNIEMDDLVGAVSLIWSVCCNDGQLLASRDLLRGVVIRPMASALAQRWKVIERTIVEGLDIVRLRGLEYGAGNHYASVNALAIIWAWLYLGNQWSLERTLSVPQRDEFEKRQQATLAGVVDRWLIGSQWAGRWSGSSQKFVEALVKDLHSDALVLRTSMTIDEAQNVLALRATALVKGLESDATNYVNNVATGARERVSLYRNVLWVWHRLDARRWDMSGIPLKVGKSGLSIDVDHVVSFSLWKRRISGAALADVTDTAEAEAIANSLGNCSLLEKTFNISKSGTTMRSFLEQVYEFKSGKASIADWSAALALTDALVDPAHVSVDSIARDIGVRDRQVRDEVIDFIRGTKARVDV